MTAAFSRKVDENSAILGHYTASSGNFLPTFRDNLSVPSSGFMNPKDWTLKMGPKVVPKRR